MLGVLLTLAVKPGLISLAGVALVKNSQRQSANYRYFILSLAFFLLPLSWVFTSFLPSWNIDVMFNSDSLWLWSGSALFNRWPFQAYFFAYCVIALWLSLYNLLGYYALSRRCSLDTGPDDELQTFINQMATKMAIKRPVRLLLAGNDKTPCTWGIWRPVIQLPESAQAWSKPILTMIVLHELAHIRNFDFPRKLLSYQIAALFWVFPWLWWMLRTSEEMAEQAADNWVLRFGNSDADYAQILLSAKQGKLEHESAALAIHGHGDYYQRILGVLDRYADRSTSPAMEQRTVMIFALSVIVLLASIGVHPQAYPQYHFQWPMNIQLDAQEVSKQIKTQADNSKNFEMLAPKFIVIDAVPQRSHMEEMHVAAQMEIPISPTPVKLERPEVRGQVSMSGYLPLKITSPIYPRRAVQKQLQTTLTASFSIDTNGKPKNITITSGDHQQVFSSAVINAIKDFEYQPPTINGEKVQLDHVTETFSFKIEK